MWECFRSILFQAPIEFVHQFHQQSTNRQNIVLTCVNVDNNIVNRINTKINQLKTGNVLRFFHVYRTQTNLNRNNISLKQCVRSRCRHAINHSSSTHFIVNTKQLISYISYVDIYQCKKMINKWKRSCIDGSEMTIFNEFHLIVFLVYGENRKIFCACK